MLRSETNNLPVGGYEDAAAAERRRRKMHHAAQRLFEKDLTSVCAESIKGPATEVDR